MKIAENELLELFEKINDFGSADKTFSPCFSNTGIEVNKNNYGSGALWLHYNRASRKLWKKLFDFNLKQNTELSSAFNVVYGDKNSSAKITFCDTDTIVFCSENLPEINLFCEADQKLSEFYELSHSKNSAEYFGYSVNADDRDPDETVPFYAYLKIIKGTFDPCGLSISSESGCIYFIISFEFLDITCRNAKHKAENAPESFRDAKEKCENFYRTCIKDYSAESDKSTPTELIAKAVYGLSANLAKAPGKLKNHISSYPSRGAYPTHFLWDTCFQNLAYEELSLTLAKDFLLQNAECQREDGKYAQFLCSTWERPHYSQPALIGWAALRIIEKDFDKAFAEKILDSIEKNNNWWLNSRRSRNGLIMCPHGLETGQDDSPRFDSGTTYACDMNAYVLHQLKTASRLNLLLGNKEKASQWEEKSKELSEKIIEILYCEEDNIFYDVLPSSGKFIKIVSPVSFLPLWAGVTLPENKAKQSIEKYLLSSEYLFGDVPFPSVAYNEETYEENGWWRGPTWMPNAYLMLETLYKFGYQKEYITAAERLYNVIIKDGEMHELFNSKTGEGLGASEQGWTNAIFIKLHKIIHNGESL